MSDDRGNGGEYEDVIVQQNRANEHIIIIIIRSINSMSD